MSYSVISMLTLGLSYWSGTFTCHVRLLLTLRLSCQITFFKQGACQIKSSFDFVCNRWKIFRMVYDNRRWFFRGRLWARVQSEPGPTWRDLFWNRGSKKCADALKMTPGHYSPDGYGSTAQVRTSNLRGDSYKRIGSPPYYSYWSGAPPQWGAVGLIYDFKKYLIFFLS